MNASSLNKNLPFSFKLKKYIFSTSMFLWICLEFKMWHIYNDILIQRFILFDRHLDSLIQTKGPAHRRNLWKSSPNSKRLSRNFRAPLCSSSFLYRSLKSSWTSSMSLSTYVSVRIFWKPTWVSRSTQSDTGHWLIRSITWVTLTLTTNTSSNSLSSLYLRRSALWVKELFPLLSCKNKRSTSNMSWHNCCIWLERWMKKSSIYTLTVFSYKVRM